MYFLRHGGKASGAAAHQGIKEFQHPRVADRQPQHIRYRARIDRGKAGQPQHQFAGLRHAERTDGDAAEIGVEPRHRIAAGDQQPAAARPLRQEAQVSSGILVQEGAAPGLQIVLEIVEHEEDAFLRQHLPEERQPHAIIEIGADQLFAEPARRRAIGLQQHRAEGDTDRGKVEPAAMGGYQPAALGRAGP